MPIRAIWSEGTNCFQGVFFPLSVSNSDVTMLKSAGWLRTSLSPELSHCTICSSRAIPESLSYHSLHFDRLLARVDDVPRSPGATVLTVDCIPTQGPKKRLCVSLTNERG